MNTAPTPVAPAPASAATHPTVPGGGGPGGPEPRRVAPLAVVLRTAWFLGALFWSAFAVLEGINHGSLAALLAFAAFIAPDLTMLIGARESAGLAHGHLSPRAVPFYNAAHGVLVPLALLVPYAFGAFTWAPFFAALCGWLAHISYDRAFGFGLRTKEGHQRG